MASFLPGREDVHTFACPIRRPALQLMQRRSCERLHRDVISARRARDSPIVVRALRITGREHVKDCGSRCTDSSELSASEYEVVLHLEFPDGKDGRHVE